MDLFTVGLNSWVKFYLIFILLVLCNVWLSFLPLSFLPFKETVPFEPIFSSVPNLYISTCEILSSKIEDILYVCIKIAHFQTA